MCMWAPELILRCSSWWWHPSLGDYSYPEGTGLTLWLREKTSGGHRQSYPQLLPWAATDRNTRKSGWRYGYGSFLFSGDPWGSVSHISHFFICLGEPFIGVQCHSIWSHISSLLACRKCLKKTRPCILTTQCMTHAHGEKTRFIWMLMEPHCTIKIEMRGLTHLPHCKLS